MLISANLGEKYTFNTKDNSLTINDGETVISSKEMQEISDAHIGINRIYKPIGLLFWTDCKNGKASNWD